MESGIAWVLVSTKPQFELAKDSRQFWLYVVEWARTEMATVYPIPIRTAALASSVLMEAGSLWPSMTGLTHRPNPRSWSKQTLAIAWNSLI